MPGKGKDSFLYIVTTRSEEDFEMPPKEADKLSQEQTWWIRDWIDAGAPWPDEKRIAAIQEEFSEGEQVATSKALSASSARRALCSITRAMAPRSKGRSFSRLIIAASSPT